MCLQWTLINGFLCTEIALLLLLMRQRVSPERWNKLVKSRIQGPHIQANNYFMIFLGILALFWLIAICRLLQSLDLSLEHHHLDIEVHNLRLFKAQTNVYISGLALLLALVIHHTITLISSQGALITQVESIFKQPAGDRKEVEELKQQIQELKNKLFLEAIIMIRMRQEVARLKEKCVILSEQPIV